MECFRVKRRWQRWQENGRSPVCDLTCRRKSSADQKRRKQKAQVTCENNIISIKDIFK